MSFTASIGSTSAIAALFSPFTTIASVLYGDKAVPFTSPQFENPIEVNQTFNVFEPKPEFIFIETTVEEASENPVDLYQSSIVECGPVFGPDPGFVSVEPTVDNTTIIPADIPAGFEVVTIDGQEFLAWVDPQTNTPETIPDKLVNGLDDLLSAWDNYIVAPMQEIIPSRTTGGWILSGTNFYFLISGLLSSRHKFTGVILPYLLTWAPGRTVTTWVFCIAKIVLFWMKLASQDQLRRIVRDEAIKNEFHCENDRRRLQKGQDEVQQVTQVLWRNQINQEERTRALQVAATALQAAVEDLWTARVDLQTRISRVWDAHKDLRKIVRDILRGGQDLRKQVRSINLRMNSRRPAGSTSAAQGQGESTPGSTQAIMPLAEEDGDDFNRA